MTIFTGGCLCGKVRYSANTEPMFAGVCHCRNCQHFTGSAFECVIAVPAPAVLVQGSLKTYRDRGDSGGAVYRKFCPECGSGVITEVEVMPGVTMLLSGSLDDPGQFQPMMEIYCASAQPWTQAGADLPKFPGMPPAPA